MPKYNLEYKAFGPSAILINWPREISESVLTDVLNFKNLLQEHYFKQKVYLIPSYNSITISYNSTIRNIYDEILTLKSLYSSLNSEALVNRKLWTIPVCYEKDFGLDLERISEEKNLRIEDIIRIHSEAVYLVYLIGFLPGFLYLGKLNSKLHIPRLETPRPKVAAGSVAIAEQQTGIYPSESPGGWNIIGRTPITLFNPMQEHPCFASPGDQLKFKAISLEEFYHISNQVNSSTYQPQYVEL